MNRLENAFPSLETVLSTFGMRRLFPKQKERLKLSCVSLDAFSLYKRMGSWTKVWLLCRLLAPMGQSLLSLGNFETREKDVINSDFNQSETRY